MGILRLGGLIAFLMLLGAVGFLWKANEKKAEELGKVRAALTGAEATIRFKDETAALSQTHSDALARLESLSRRRMEEMINERDKRRTAAEQKALEAPLDYGDRFEFELARLFCLFEAGADRVARKACDLHPPEAYRPAIALTLTVTPELAERWHERCVEGGEGSEDFCRWAVTGFTTQGGITILNHLERLAQYALALEDRADMLEDQLRELAAAPEGGPKRAGAAGR